MQSYFSRLKCANFNIINDRKAMSLYYNGYSGDQFEIISP